MNCPTCGTNHTSNFCPNCGTAATQSPQGQQYDYNQQASYDQPQNQQTQPPIYDPQYGQQEPLKKKGGCLKIGLIVLGAFVVLGIIIGVIIGFSAKETVSISDTPTSSESRTSSTAVSSIAASGVTQEATAATTTPSMTASQEQAIRKAESYLEFMAFSRQGLIEQLEYDGFSNADASFAVDNITVDWNEQAAEKAASYLEFMAFSRQGLIEQLEFDGFTYEQALYGADSVGL